MLMKKQKISFSRDPISTTSIRQEIYPTPAVNIPIEDVLFKMIERIYATERRVPA